MLSELTRLETAGCLQEVQCATNTTNSYLEFLFIGQYIINDT